MTLPDNYELRVGRLESTLRRLRKNPPLLDKYHKVIQDQIEAGVIEEVKPHLQESIPSKEPCRTHYLSHHGVVREEAVTTKLRVVFAEAPKLNLTPQVSMNVSIQVPVCYQLLLTFYCVSDITGWLLLRTQIRIKIH